MTSRSRLVRRSVALAVAVCAVLVGLTGCAFGPGVGGQTALQATHQIEQIPGVVSAIADSDTDTQSARDTQTSVVVTLDPDYTVGDSTKALDWLLKTAWSLNNTHPTGQITVGFNYGTGKPVSWSWKGSITELGIKQSTTGYGFYKSTGPAAGTVDFDPNPVQKFLGTWPGKVPALPAGVIVKR